MRLLHTSDWHLGRRLHGQELLAEQARFLDWLVETASAQDVAAVLVSGDVYDRAQPGAEAIALLDRTVAAFARRGIPLIITSGNHDSAVRLQYAGAVMAEAGIHLRTTVEQVTDPVVLADPAGPVAVYGIPYVLPDAVVAELEVERSHTAVLAALMDRVRRDVHERGLGRVVVMAHAFVTGGSACESEREIRVGGVGDVPAEVFDGVGYVALGHLHGPQVVRLPGSATVLEYSGSPLAFSFSERDHVKSVTLVDVDAGGSVTTRRLPVPVPRRLVQVTGRLHDLLERAPRDLADLAEAWVKVVLTDPGRLANAMEQLREAWPHTLVLELAPERAEAGIGLARATESSDPVEICAQFVADVSGEPPTDAQLALLAQVVREVRRSEAVA
jgi:exonuclease SbcD